MNILVIGGGGREHALTHTFHRQGHRVYCIPGNAGTAKICQPLPEKWAELDANDYNSLAQFAKENSIDLTVVGPEAHLEAGIANIFNSKGLKIFGPNKQAATLESSKSWSKEFMARHTIPTGAFVICHDSKSARQAIEEFFHAWGGVVIKPSGLTAGKGVVCCNTLEEAEQAIREIMEDQRFGNAGSSIVIEQYLRGTEVSIHAFCDGNTIIPMLPAQDHKRLYDGGQGPNTGGIGAYTPTPFLDDATIAIVNEQIVQRTCIGLKKEGITFNGVIYFGLMLTNEGPKVLEYNCRFGDPETQVLLPLLESDLAEVMTASCNQQLHNCHIHWKTDAACCVVMVSRGYPKNYTTGHAISGLQEAERHDRIIVFHAGTAVNADGAAVSAGGRVLGITGLGDTLEEAVQKAYEGVELISFNGEYHRSDIAYRAYHRATSDDLQPV
ncbi:MAG: phosphoribosylamine--glycine ligase [Chlamydiales bacterium]|nr:phosphoribosylamine--glycine ligase [Chlamydiia bacterium]MCP5508487.1 phosphoribosylamine--glycine ligase [Chlamydiales bacterium]